MLRQRDVRASLASLFKIGMLELQEVPRSSDRAPSRSFFLWFHNFDRSRALLISQMKKGMCRCLQRIRYERQLRARTLEKLERQKVSHKGAQLNKIELEDFARLKSIEARLWTQVFRIDNSIMLLDEI